MCGRRGVGASEMADGEIKVVHPTAHLKDHFGPVARSNTCQYQAIIWEAPGSNVVADCRLVGTLLLLLTGVWPDGDGPLMSTSPLYSISGEGEWVEGMR
jgi:hypothetical protein